MRKIIPVVVGTVAFAGFLALFVWVYLSASSADTVRYAWAAGPAQVAGSMAEAVQLWQSGPHADVACLECHQEVDPEQLRQAYAQGTSIDLTGWLKVDQGRCEECHSPQMAEIRKDIMPVPLTPGHPTSTPGQPMKTKAMHDLHLNKEARCVDCHAVHQPADQRPHETCLSCHEQKQVTLAVKGDVSCTACHLDLAAITPDDHKETARWLRAHGKASQSQSCGECHMSASAGPHAQGLTNLALFPSEAQGDTCVTCHAGVVMPHEASFLARHGKEALSAKPGTCEQCHAPQAGETVVPAHAAPQYCTDCHRQPMPHPASFLASHGSTALQSPATCEACHSSQNPVNPTAPHSTRNYCASCHSAYQHPQGWVAQHGSQVTDSCATCHSTAQGGEAGHNACAACHTSEGTWHEKMWFIKHGRVVETEGKESCLKCHAEVQPSCSKCHSER